MRVGTCHASTHASGVLNSYSASRTAGPRCTSFPGLFSVRPIAAPAAATCMRLCPTTPSATTCCRAPSSRALTPNSESLPDHRSPGPSFGIPEYPGTVFWSTAPWSKDVLGNPSPALSWAACLPLAWAATTCDLQYFVVPMLARRATDTASTQTKIPRTNRAIPYRHRDEDNTLCSRTATTSCGPYARIGRGVRGA